MMESIKRQEPSVDTLNPNDKLEMRALNRINELPATLKHEAMGKCAGGISYSNALTMTLAGALKEKGMNSGHAADVAAMTAYEEGDSNWKIAIGFLNK